MIITYLQSIQSKIPKGNVLNCNPKNSSIHVGLVNGGISHNIIRLPSFNEFWTNNYIELPKVNEKQIMLKQFYVDPIKNPLNTPSGKIEITSETIKNFKTAKDAVIKAGLYAYRDRRQRKRQFRRLWIIRINAACRMNGITYSDFIHGLKTKGIEKQRNQEKQRKIKENK